MSKRRLVYGLVPHQQSLAFLPEDDAISLAGEIADIRMLTTVGEARAYSPRLTHVPDLDALDDEAADDEPYSALDSGEHADGDWPRMVTQVMAELLPADVAAAIGSPVDTMLNGSYLDVPAGTQDEVLARLASLGYECRRDDRLILACELVDEADFADALRQIR